MEKRYRVNEIFYSLQGEGRWAGRAAVFVRFCGCNLQCPFCDTDFKEGQELTAEEIISTVKGLSKDCRFLVFTGGEPSLQLDENITTLLHQDGYFITTETNGTHPLPKGIDWVTLSPKDSFVNNGNVILKRVNEIKVVFDAIHEIRGYDDIETEFYFVQPCDTGDKEHNKAILNECIDFILKNPKWQLSLQQHKIINVR